MDEDVSDKEIWPFGPYTPRINPSLHSFLCPLQLEDDNHNMIIHGSMRLVLRRSAHRHPQFFSHTKRQRSTAVDKPAERPSAPSKREASPTATYTDTPPRPLWERFGPLSVAFTGYARAQKHNPWITQLGTSLVVYLCGDLTAQYIDGEEYNPFRTLRHLTIGGVMSIPAYTW